MPNSHKTNQTQVEPAQVATITDLVSYQTGSIVSREILKGEAGKVTLFAFDHGEGLSEHTSPFNALVHVVEGEAAVTIAGRPFRVGAGAVLLLPAGQPHALQAVHRFKMVLTMIRS